MIHVTTDSASRLKSRGVPATTAMSTRICYLIDSQECQSRWPIEVAQQADTPTCTGHALARTSILFGVASVSTRLGGPWRLGNHGKLINQIKRA